MEDIITRLTRPKNGKMRIQVSFDGGVTWQWEKPKTKKENNERFDVKGKRIRKEK